MLRRQGCDQLTQQILLTGLGGLTGWGKDAVEPPTTQPRRFGPGAAHGDDPALSGASPYIPRGFSDTAQDEQFLTKLHDGQNELGFSDGQTEDGVPDRFYLFGSTGADLAEVSENLARTLAAELEEHESSYAGGIYFLLRSAQFEKATVEENWTDEEGNQSEPDFPDYSTLVYLTNPDQSVLTSLGGMPDLTRLRLDEVT
ncbi:hypothetical protein ACFC8N_38715 [Streptomyces sp. NPDC055966]|uniref:hypothetical protein n=1 Tax=unclassified Streptomyces TaxID=2593676 RepID=UPI0035D96F79